MQAVGDAHVHAVVLHGRVEKLLQGRPQPVHLVDEQDIPGLERREHADQVARALEHGARGRADIDAELSRHEEREGGLAEPRGAEEEGMVEGLVALLRGVDRDLQGFLHLGLADELVEPGGPEGGIGQALVRERLGRGDLRARPPGPPGPRLAHAARVPSGRARHRTGLASRSSACGVWQVTHSSTARVAASGTSLRLVEPQRVQIHSAVVAIVIRG